MDAAFDGVCAGAVGPEDGAVLEGLGCAAFDGEFVVGGPAEPAVLPAALAPVQLDGSPGEVRPGAWRPVDLPVLERLGCAAVEFHPVVDWEAEVLQMLLIAAIDIGSYRVNLGIGGPIDGTMLICTHSAIVDGSDSGDFSCRSAEPCVCGGICVNCPIGRIRVRGLIWIRICGLIVVGLRAFAGWLLLRGCRGVCCICR